MFPSPAESAPSLKNMSKKNAVSFVRIEPAFIQKFKEKIGYKEEPDINAKVGYRVGLCIFPRVLSC